MTSEMIYGRSCGRILHYHVYVWADATIHAGWGALTRYARLLEATRE